MYEGEDRDRRLANGEGGCLDDRRDQAFETRLGLRQFARDARRAGSYLAADVVGDDLDEAIAIFRRQPLPGVLKAPSQTSIHSRPSGLSMISTMAGSFSQSSIAAPIAVWSMSMANWAALDLRGRETVPTIAPGTCDCLVQSDFGDN
jgi:hypothetical protein